MEEKSIPTKGRTLDHAANVYDLFEPVVLLGRQAEYDYTIVRVLELKEGDRVLDLGCGTGVLTRMIAERLKPGGRLIIADMHTPSTFMGWFVSHVSRWFFMQPQIDEIYVGFCRLLSKTLDLHRLMPYAVTLDI